MFDGTYAEEIQASQNVIGKSWINQNLSVSSPANTKTLTCGGYATKHHIENGTDNDLGVEKGIFRSSLDDVKKILAGWSTITLAIPNQGAQPQPNPAPQGPVAGADYNWRDDAVLSQVPIRSFTGTDYGSAFYRDILSRTTPSYFDEPATSAHESLHQLHSDMRKLKSPHYAFVYHRDGVGLHIKEPIENLIDVKNHIGSSFQQLAANTYKLYLVDQLKYWTNSLYIFDEWGAYIATSRVAVETHAAGQWSSRFAANFTDPLEGMSEFMYYCSADILAIKSADPTYLATNKQFKAAFAMNMEESIFWLNEARKDPYWSRSRSFGKFQNLQTSPDAKEVRDAIRDLMGAPWTNRVMGF